MPDTMTLTKVVGAFCGAFLAFLLLGWVAESLYHHGESETQAYVIDTGEEEAATEEAAAPAEEGPAFAELYAAADAAAGETLFRACQACHKLDGSDGTGPHLNGVVDRPKASIAGFAYSDALLAMTADAWTPENLDGFLADPKGYAPGTKMTYSGMRKPVDRANLIAYLAGTSG